jgi:ATP-binding cassette, subfamily B, bacterial
MLEMKVPNPLSGSRRTIFAGLCAIAFAQAGLAAATAFLVRNVFDAIVAPPAADGVSAEAMAIAALVLVALALAWLRHRERVVAEAFGQDYTHIVRMKLYDRLGSLMPRDLQDRSRGGHLLRFIGDLSALRQWVSLGLARLCVASITTVVSLLALSIINLALAVTISVVLVMTSAAAFAMGHKLRGAARETRRRRARLAGDISERIALMSVVLMFSQIRRERGRVERRSSDLRDAMIGRARVIGALRGVTEAATGISVAAILAVGAYEINQGRATLGAIVAATSVLGMLMPALRDLSRSYEYWHSYRVALDRISAFLGTRPSVEPGASAPVLPDGPGSIAFKNVAFEKVLDGINVTAESGSVVAIVGPNGAGKSTLLALIARLIEPTSGQVLFDGNDLRRFRASSVRATIGVVSPDLPLMRGTIGRNIRYRCPRATEDEVRRVNALCGVDEILDEIPGGMEARVAEGGVNLSPGQRQRIALARALLGAPRLLLLDEVDANMDPESARLIDRVLKAYQGTVIFVSHRPHQVAQADVIWHIADGSITEQGPPTELLHRDGPTRRLMSRPLEFVA